jgi:diphthine-ammonia ligase
MDLNNGRAYFCSWSVGKDSCLALYKTMQLGYCPKFLFTTCFKASGKSYSHNLSVDVLHAQAKCLGLPLVICNTAIEDYKDVFIKKINEARQNLANVAAGVFGDIDIEEHRAWVQKVCLELNCEPVLPLWKCDRKTIITEFLELGFKAQIVVVHSKKLGTECLGRIIDEELLEEFTNKSIELCGENGEFHTVVVDGPIFNAPLKIKKIGAPRLYSEYWIQQFCI